VRVKNVVSEVDRLLSAAGFVRRKHTWNRGTDPVEVIDLQVSKAGDSVTVNVGVLDREVYAMIWDSEVPAVVDEPSCTVRVRIGVLIDGKDRWWSLDDSQTAQELVENIRTYALPFLDHLRSEDAMEQWLIDTRVAKQSYPPPVLSLAILQARHGDQKSACALLLALQQKVSVGAWRDRTAIVAERLGCN
jgi:hypothetical protein